MKISLDYPAQDEQYWKQFRVNLPKSIPSKLAEELLEQRHAALQGGIMTLNQASL